MRACLVTDLLCAARLVSSAGPDGAGPLARRLIHEAHAAHKYAKRFGRPHPLWGSGSLMARALAADMPASDARFDLHALIVVAQSLLQFRKATPPKGSKMVM